MCVIMFLKNSTPRLTMYILYRIQVVFHMLIPISVWNWNEHCGLAIRIVNSTHVQPKMHEVSPNYTQYRWYVHTHVFSST